MNAVSWVGLVCLSLTAVGAYALGRSTRRDELLDAHAATIAAQADAQQQRCVVRAREQAIQQKDRVITDMARARIDRAPSMVMHFSGSAAAYAPAVARDLSALIVRDGRR